LEMTNMPNINIAYSLLKMGCWLLRHSNEALITFVHDEHSNVELNEDGFAIKAF